MMSTVIRTLVFLLVAGCSGWLANPVYVGAAEQSVRPGINRAYEEPDFERWLETFERPGREVYDQRHRIAAATGLEPGMEVADVGAGTGLFTWLFAREVGPSGRVYAVDIADEFIRNIERLAAQRGFANVTAIVNSQRSVGLAPRSVDLVFVCNTYHHFEYPEAMLASIHRALRHRGRLVVIDFRKEEDISSPWVMGHVRADKERVLEEITANGFRLQRERDLLDRNYFLEFEKRRRQPPIR